jgi:hypothetical protein
MLHMELVVYASPTNTVESVKSKKLRYVGHVDRMLNSFNGNFSWEMDTYKSEEWGTR